MSEYTEWIDGIPVHPVAALFPMIGDDELRALADDIKANGQREPIIVTYVDEMMMDEPVVIDGRNRYAACKIAGVAPKFNYVRSLDDEEVSPGVIADWIISHNLHRRHLTTSQKAMVGQGYLAYLKEEAKKRQDSGRVNSHASRRGELVSPKSDEPKKVHGSRSDVEAARLVGVGKNSIRDADFVVQNDPELAQQVRDSKVTVSAAAKRIRESLNPKPEPTPEEQAEKLARAVLKNPETISKMAAEIIAEYFGGEITW